MSTVIVRSVTSHLWGANCHVVAAETGGDAVIIDPGYDVAPRVHRLLARDHLRAVAVLLTHGHVDHTWQVVPLCEEFEVPAAIHPSDRAQLADPASGLGRELAAALAQMGAPATEPDRVEDLCDRVTLELAGLTFTVMHTPGHTPGSVMFRLAPDGSAEAGPDGLVFSGDTLFAGSVGRTDLPGGDAEALMRSLATRVATLPEGVRVLPGHGQPTTLAQERLRNPWLAEAGGDPG